MNFPWPSRALTLLTTLLIASSPLLAQPATPSLASWKEYRATATKDPSLVRFYSFDEGQGGRVSDAAGSSGTLNIKSNDLYFNPDLVPMVRREDYPRWTEGRWPDKSALTIGTAAKSVGHSLFYGVPTNTLTIEAWVRLHPDSSTKGNTTLISVGDGSTAGWKLAADTQGTAFNIGRPPGTNPGQGGVTAYANRGLSQGVWHHLVAIVDGNAKALLLYIDGTLATQQPFDGVYIQPQPPASNESTPELDRGGLMLGAINNLANKARFDIDELAIYNRVLPPAVIAEHFRAGQVDASAEVQAQAHRVLLEKQAALDQITMAVETRTGYLPQGQPLPVAVTIGPEAQLNGKYRASVRLFSPSNVLLWQGGAPVVATPGKETSAKVDVPTQACGLYRLKVALEDANKHNIKELLFPIGVRRAQLPVSQMPASAPLAHFGTTNMHPEDFGLGGNFERIIHPWCPISPQGGYDWTYPDMYVKTAMDNGLVPFYTIMTPMEPTGPTTFREMAHRPDDWEKWVRELVTHFKGRISYWEVLNEPNGGGQLTPQEYVIMLKIAFRVIREVDPAAKVVGIGGTNDFAQWTEDVFAAGAGPYVDIVCFHDYIGTSPIQSWKLYRRVERVRAATLKYAGRPLPLWNGECGIHQPARLNGRPITDEELLQMYPGRSRKENGWATARVDAIMMTTEHRSACWQVQSILADLVSGAEKYFLLMGSGRYYPYSISDSQDLPSEKGLALAALGSVTANMDRIRLIPLSSSDAMGVMITDKNGKNTAVFFSDKKVTLTLNLAGNRPCRGMDYIGNPLTWSRKQSVLSVPVSDEPTYLLDVPADLAENQLLALKTLPAQVAPGQTVAGELTVTNPTERSISGTLTLSATGCRVSSPSVLTLAPREQKSVPFTLVAGALERGQYALVAQMAKGNDLLSRREFAFASEGVTKAVPHRTQPIILDGDGADWAGIEGEKMDQARQVVLGRPDVGAADTRLWWGPKDLSCEMKAAWESDGIYLWIDVTDNALTVAPEDKTKQGYKWDCLELFFDGRPLKDQSPTYSTGAEQVVVVPRVGDTVAPCPVVNLAHDKPTLDVEFVGKKTVTGYVLEGRIKVRPESPVKLMPGQRFGMDISLDDADNGERRVQMVLHGSEKNSFDTSQWGRYQLSGAN